MKDLLSGPCGWLILFLVVASQEVRAQAEVIHYDSGYTWRGYTGTTAPTCASKLCHRYAIYSWDSFYKEFTGWKSLNGDPNSAHAFINFRVLFPPGYNIKDQVKKYPLVIMMHGAGESGRVWTDHFNYATTDPMFDNNGHQLRYGANEHRVAAAKPATDPGSCQAIVVFPQASYSASWSDLSSTATSENEQILLGFIESQMILKYHADPNRVIMHGISNGAKEMWALATKRPDLFAVILPMSAVPSDYELTTDVLVTSPIWHFQGGLDINPSPNAAQSLVDMFESKGGKPRFTIYPDVDHEVWFKAYKEVDFFSWMMAQDKRKIFVFGSSTEICSEPIRLGFSAGMMEYQWMRNGVDMPGRTARYLTVASAGTYAVKFKRPNGQWDQSLGVQLTAKPGCVITAVGDVHSESAAFPNPTHGVVTIAVGDKFDPNAVQVVSMLGQLINVPLEVVDETTFTLDLGSAVPGVYVIRLTDSGRVFVVVRN